MKNKIAKYIDLKKIKAIDNGDSFVKANFFDNSIRCEYILMDMKEIFQDDIFVRREVAKMLSKANNLLQKKFNNLTLSVAYGYRSLDIQKRYFDKEHAKLMGEDVKEDKIIETVHKKVAVADVAGHPTGGAVDVTIFNNLTKEIIDMGGTINNISDKRIKTFSQGLTLQQKNNRMLLLEVMTESGFCPFYGEWWHFSYGDKDWAFFYDKKNAIYDKVEIDEILNRNNF